jgi:hypothetical protein
MGKLAGRRVTFHAPARMGAIAAALAAAATLLLPNAALASTQTIGSAVGDVDCGGIAADTIQLSSSGTTSYAVPTGGVSISSWYYQVGSDTGSINLLIWRPTAPSTYTLVAVSPTVNLADSTSTFTLDAPIPVLPGDVIGLRLSGPLTCASYIQPKAGTFGTDTVGIAFSTTALGGTMSIDRVGQDLRLNVAAVVEVTSNPVPASADQCKNGGWHTLTDSKGRPFRNQGDCVSFFATDGTNLAAG